MQAGNRFFATPLWAGIQEGLAKLTVDEDAKQPKTTRIVQMAQRAARAMGRRAYLVLDAYFAVGPVFQAADGRLCGDEPLVYIRTRAKKNVVAYRPAPTPRKRKRGRRKKYGQRLKLMTLFDSQAKAHAFQTAQAVAYRRPDRFRYRVLDLLWKPTKGMLRFIRVDSPRGRMILISSDLRSIPSRPSNGMAAA